ncbi:MAG: CDP-archaeol synthase [Clostridia bacterium]|nr:CDP-archaeol synthase [Clostridia bacterium]
MNFIKHFVLAGKAKPIEWLGYLAAALICIIHVVQIDMILRTIGILLPMAMLVLFAYVIATNGKTTIQDIAITFFGIFYVVVFLLFIPVIREDLKEGKILIWFVFFSAWGTDIFAYLIGRHFGKHHFTEISPNKTIEGCIGGTIGGVVTVVIYGLVCNFVFHTQMNYILLVVTGILLSLSGQLGDLAASAIKRYTEIKDFSNLIPGHGGMMDRIDSIIFIAPFAYFLLPMLIR